MARRTRNITLSLNPQGLLTARAPRCVFWHNLRVKFLVSNQISVLLISASYLRDLKSVTSRVTLCRPCPIKGQSGSSGVIQYFSCQLFLSKRLRIRLPFLTTFCILGSVVQSQGAEQSTGSSNYYQAYYYYYFNLHIKLFYEKHNRQE